MLNIQRQSGNSKFIAADWANYSSKIIASLGLKQIAKGEWHGACPNCGGKDRFWISPRDGDVKLHCRQCNDFPAMADALRSQGLWPEVESNALPAIRDNLSDFDVVKEPYHKRKQIGLHRAELKGDTVVVPMRNLSGDIVGHQRIMPDGGKRWTPGMTFDEPVFHVVGSGQTVPTYVCEGWADAVSLHEATGLTALFACSANHLPIVAKALSALKPNTLIVAADNDKPGIKAVVESGLPFVLPPKGSDWNDLYRSGGAESVTEALDHTFSSADATDMLEALQGAPEPPQTASVFIADPVPLKIDSSADFLSDLRPLEYLIEGILPTGAVYSMTGYSGHGKTTLALQMALSVALGEEFNGREVSQGSVLFLAGENPDNVKWQYAAALALRGLKASGVPIYFHQGRFSVSQMTSILHERMENIPNLKLIIVDSLQSFFEGTNDNDNMEMVLMAHAMRRISDTPSKPAQVIIAHPAGKTPNKDNLVPRGGSAFLNEIDGNLTVWSNDEAQQTLHHSQKFRGAGFEPSEWMMKTVSFDHLVDIKGNPVKLRVSTPEMITERSRREDEADNLLRRWLATVAAGQALSVREMASQFGVGRYKAEVAIRTARDEKLVRRYAKTYVLTPGGEEFLEG